MKNVGGTYINYTYAREGYDSWTSCFPGQFNSVEEVAVRYEGEPQKVHGQIHEIESGLSYRITNETLSTDLEYSNQTCDGFNLILYFYEFSYDGKISFQIGKSLVENDGPSYRAVILTNTGVSQKLSLKKGTVVKGLAIMISEAWMKENLRGSDFSKYQQLCKNELVLDYLTAKHQKILNDIFQGVETAKIPALFANSRVLRLLGNFMEALFIRDVAEIKESITPKDFQSVLKIETFLLQTYDEGFPKIENLARLALMSESKLKKLYKRAFGMGLYEYYQKNRMHKAKELLHSGNYSVSQVGSMLGYQNLSNFSASFKKEFNFTPSDFMQAG